MQVHRIDPVQDPRWAEFVEWHPQASIFHTPEWMKTLRRTYGYEPIAFTTCAPGERLTNGIPFCRISTWLTGRRLVSLPFSDHCAPLACSTEELDLLLTSLESQLQLEHCSYLELRTQPSYLQGHSHFQVSETYHFHSIDLRPGLAHIYQSLHKNCIQRKIRRAKREGLTCVGGNSNALLEQFYALLLRTRKRQGLPPQPLSWYKNLIECLGPKAKIWVAFKNGCSIASILTLYHRKVVFHKYGCSDFRFNNLGGTQLLYWNAIEEAERNGFEEFDLGRSDSDNPTLATFKARWGASRSSLAYARCSVSRTRSVVRKWPLNLAKHLFARLPDTFLAAAGRLLYRHIG